MSLASGDWGSRTSAASMLERLIEQEAGDERDLRLFSSSCARLALEMVDRFDQKIRTEALMVIDFAERMAREGVQPPPASELAELAEIAEMEDHFHVPIGPTYAPLHPEANWAAYGAMLHAIGAYAEQERGRAREPADPELVNLPRGVSHARDDRRGGPGHLP